MKIQKIKLVINEGRMSKQQKAELKPSKTGFKYFQNNTQDQFPYIESAINIMDSNLKWWQKNWEAIQNKIEEVLPKAAEDAFERLKDTKVRTHFTIFSGKDSKSADILHTGPAIQYVFSGMSSTVVKNIMKSLETSGLLKGHKMFIDGDTLIVMF